MDGAMIASVLFALLFDTALLWWRSEFSHDLGLFTIYSLQRLCGALAVVALVSWLLRRTPKLARVVVGAYAAFIWVDAEFYFIGFTRLERDHFTLIAPDYLARFFGLPVALFLSAFVFSLLLALRSKEKPRLVLGLVLGMLAALQLPHWLVEKTEDAAKQETISRLLFLTQHPFFRVGEKLLGPNRFTVTTDEEQWLRTAKALGLPIVARDNTTGSVYRHVVLLTVESLSAELEPSYASHGFTHYWTTGSPTRQGLTVTYASHPNPDLVAALGASHSFVHRLQKFRRVFVKGDARTYSPEYSLLRSWGFDEVIAREQLATEGTTGIGVPDVAVYQAIVAQLVAHRDESIFIGALNTDTHPGWGLPDISEQLHKHEREVEMFLAAVKSAGLWDEQLLIVLTADHCRPNAVDMLCRIPLVFLSGAVLPEMRKDQLASQIDLAPTLLDLLGLPRVRGHWGRSLLRARPDFAVGSFAGRIRVRTAETEAHPTDGPFLGFWNTLLQ